MIPFNYRELRENAEHVLRSMQRRYPGYVSRGRLTAQEAEDRFAIQAATIDLLRELEKTEQLI
jgi:antibiotic biosynthesis monooxygenase (ABM) superfamily enzyme